LAHNRTYILRQRKRVSGIGASLELISEFLEEDLAQPSGASINNIANSLYNIASLESAHGLVSVFDGDDQGWELISKSLYYYYWSTRIKVEFYSDFEYSQQRGGLTSCMPVLAGLLASFISLEQNDLAQSAYEMLCYIMFEEGRVESEYLSSCSYEPFIVWLYCEYAQMQAPEALKDYNFGVYEAVKLAWETPDQLTAALKDVIAYHHTQTKTSATHKWYPVFEDSPFGAILFEVFAINKTLKAKSFNLDIFESVVPDDPFKTIDHIQLYQDETLNGAEAALTEVLQSLER